MTRSFIYILLLVLGAAAAAVGLWSSFEVPSQVAEDSLGPRGTTAVVAVSAAREAFTLSLLEQASAVAQEVELRALSEPTLMQKTQTPVLRPDKPPVREYDAVLPSMESLLDGAQKTLDRESSARGSAVIAVIDLAAAKVIASSKTDDDLARILTQLLKVDPAKRLRKAGLIKSSKGVFEVALAPVGLAPANQWVLAAWTLTPAPWTALSEKLGADLSLEVIRRGEVLLGTSPSELSSTVSSAASVLRTHDAVANPPADFLEAKAFGDKIALHRAVALDALDEEQTTTGVLITVLGSAPVATKTDLRARFYLDEPAAHGRTLGIVGGAAMLLLLLGFFIAKADANRSIKRSTRELEIAESLDEAELSTAARGMVDVALQLAAAKSAKVVPQDELKSAMQRAELEKESFESQLNQLQSQLKYAKGELTRSHTDLAQSRQLIKNLEGQVKRFETKLHTSQAQLQQAESAAVATSTAEEPIVVLPQEALQPPSRPVVGPTDMMFAIPAMASLTKKAPEPVEIPQIPEEETLAVRPALLPIGSTPARTRVAPTKVASPPSKEFDTAEVSGEEISQILDEIDSNTVPTEEIPEAAIESFGSLTEMAEHIGQLSDSQLARLSKVSKKQPATFETSNEGLDRPDTEPIEPFTASEEEQADMSEDDERNITSQLWRVNHPLEGLIGRRSRVGNTTLPGGLRMPEVSQVPSALDIGAAIASFPVPEEDTQHVIAAPPWKKGSSPPPASLSPASLLEALKRRGKGGLGDEDEETDSTKVSPLAQELFEGPVQKPAKPRTVSHSGLFTQTGSRVEQQPTDDTSYFKSLYDEFVETKKRCGESIEKITLDRFVNRLSRNKQTLMEKYGCRTVRFQVHVKAGRAALKATPVK